MLRPNLSTVKVATATFLAACLEQAHAQPLEQPVHIKPIVLIVLDSSGSMDWDWECYVARPKSA